MDGEIIYPKTRNIEKNVKSYFEGFNLVCEKIDECNYPQKKVPDFIVTAPSGLQFLLEVKSPQLTFDPKLNGYSNHRIHSKINDLVHDAAKQFRSFNPDHKLPNLIAWVSFHFQFTHQDFLDAYRGYVSINSEEPIADFRNSSIRDRTLPDWEIVNGHLWMQASNNAGIVKISTEALYIRSSESPVVAELGELLCCGST